MYDIRVMFIYSYYYMNASWYLYFDRLQNLLFDFTYAASGMQPILMQAIERLGYTWDYVEDRSQMTTAGI